MPNKLTIVPILIACTMLLGACSENASQSDQGEHIIHAQTKHKTAIEKKSPLSLKEYAAIPPDEDAKPLLEHYNEQEKETMPQYEAQGDPKRSVPLGDVLLNGQEDTTDGPLKNNRLVAFYGTPQSENMGILGRYSKETIMKKLKEKAQKFSNIDPERPAIPTIELIATVAQPSPGPEGLYITKPNDDMIKEYIDLAQKEQALLLLDVQLGRASVMQAVKEVEPYLKEPNVHLAIDTEYSVGPGEVPGRDLGHVQGADIQKAVEHVDQMVQDNNLNDKIVLVHQFGNDIIRNKDQIHSTDNVEVPLNFDGFGKIPDKVGAYGRLVRQDPIQYGGFKLFTRNDTRLMSPKEVLALEPAPAIVNYQ